MLTRKELEKLEVVDSYSIDNIDELYFVVDRSKHDSGYRRINVYGVKFDNKRNIMWAKKLTDCSDVMHFNIRTNEVERLNDTFDLFSLDSQECNVFRLFGVARRQATIKVEGCFMSDFFITIKHRYNEES